MKARPLQNLARRWRQYAHPYGRRLRSAALSLLFAMAVVGAYYLLRWLIPTELTFYDQVVTVLFIIVSTLILFPARERALEWTLARNEFALFFGRDFHHLDFMAQQKSMEEMVHESFPAFMDWLGVRFARLAVLEPNRRAFRFHVFRNGKLLKSRHIMSRSTDDLIRTLKSRGSIDINEPDLSESLRRRLSELGAASIHAFPFRRRLLGFLILHEPARNRFAPRALQFFCAKVGVSIQNHIYSYRIIDSGLYDQEYSAAQKVQSHLHNPPLPEIPGIELRRPQQKEFDTILEFFQAAEERWYTVAMASDQITMSSALALYSLVGRLYSVLRREERPSMHRVLAHLKRGLEDDAGEVNVAVFAAEIDPRSRSLTALIESADFQIHDVARPASPLTSPGWRNYLKLSPGSAYRISYRGRPLLDLRLLAPQSEDNPAAGQDLQ